jgi:hypothetical protein
MRASCETGRFNWHEIALLTLAGFVGDHPKDGERISRS